MATPPAGKLKELQAQIAEANAEKEHLEKELASLSPETAAFLRARDAQVWQLMKELPAGSCLVDILKTAYWERTEKERDGKTVYDLVPHEEYDAFVVRPRPVSLRSLLLAWTRLSQPVSLVEIDVEQFPQQGRP